MSHVFISYSRHNQPYARKLANHLLASGFDVWIDDRIDYGSRWVDVIQQAVEDCAAFVVIMSPHSRESEWVQTECQYAAQRRKPAFPLLLEGEVFFRYVSVQAVDVRDGSLPPDAFLDELAEHASRHQDRGHNVATPKEETETEPLRDAAVTPRGFNARARRRSTLVVVGVIMLALLASVLAIWLLPGALGNSDGGETQASTAGPTPVRTSASVVALETGAPREANCDYEWFFGNEYALPGDCPVSGPTEFSGLTQNFGGGVLIGLLLSDYGDGRYFVLDSSGSYQDVAYGWTEELSLVGGCVLPSVVPVFDELPYDTSRDEIIGCPLQPVQFRSLQYQATSSATEFIVYVGYLDSESPQAAVYRLAAPSSRPGTPGVWERVR